MGCTVFAIQYEAVHGLRYPHDPWCVFLCYFAARENFTAGKAPEVTMLLESIPKGPIPILVECPQLLASPNENRASNGNFRDHEAITQCITAFIVQLETAMATMTTTTTTTTTTTSRDEFLESCAADQGPETRNLSGSSARVF